MTENIADRAQEVGARRPRVSDGDNTDVIMSGMNPGEMKTNDQLIAEQLRTDPEFRAEWERTVLARAAASRSSAIARSTIFRSASSVSASA